ncbi:unnamed protein product, partial [Heterosigma akashiwo]
WGAGCVLVELFLGKPLFVAKTEAEAITKIFQVIGSPTEESWPGHTQLPYWPLLRPAQAYP